MIQGLFWLFIVVSGGCEAAFAWNGFSGGWLRWLIIALIVVNLLMFAYLDRTVPVRKAFVYIAAACLWALERFGWQWIHAALGDGDLSVAKIAVWVDLALNMLVFAALIPAMRKPSQ